MAGQMNICICLLALCGIVHALTSEDNLPNNLETFNSNTTNQNVEDLATTTGAKEIASYTDITGLIVADLKITTTPTTSNPEVSTTNNEETKKEKPVNELYPHAVLFGGICGGTIISPKWILTAAHCTISSTGSYIHGGSTNTDNGSGSVYRVKRKVVHPLFMVGPYWLNPKQYKLRQVRARFDFLLVELEKALPLDGITMKAAKLNRTYKIAPRTKVSFAGFGADYHGGYMKSDMHVRKFELQTVKECRRIFGYNSMDMICAKGTKPNFDFACNGDSGNGLVDDNGVLVGVVSWVEDDAIECRNGATVYFAKVAAVRRWIREVTTI